MHLKINFENPILISSNQEADELEITFIMAHLFKTEAEFDYENQQAGQTSRVKYGYTISGELPP
jgi:hypothetical protein